MKIKAVTRAIGLRRILKLADYMHDKVPRKRFYFDHFVGTNWKGSPDLSCGTTACAFGWGTAMPFFQRLGVYLTKPRGFNYATPALKGHRNLGFEKISKLIFGLDAYETSYLFIPGYGIGFGENVTPKRWARFARAFVARKRESA